MKLAVVHYHLNRSGVTQVIVNQLRALNGKLAGSERLEVALFYGGRSEGWPLQLAEELTQLTVSRHEVPELDYDHARPGRQPLAPQLQASLLAAGLTPADTVVQAHNHALGKNRELPEALRNLAAAGYALLLQIHDFAEDFRPDNYRVFWEAADGMPARDVSATLYPQAPHVHYAVLNGRDAAILRQAGVDPARLHLLANAVEPGRPADRSAARRKLAQQCGIPERQRYVLYPVRGIRRKNLGEWLLWAVLADGETWFGLTLPPLNPRERPAYEAWQQLAHALQLPCRFEVGGPQGLEFAENLAAADRLLTTSVAEGFGLVFLEAWLAQRMLVGRDLPEITGDFVAAGMRFPHLHPQLLVPVDWVGKRLWQTSLADAFRQASAAYGHPDANGALTAAIDGLLIQDCVDFAVCGTALQRQIIERAARDPASRGQLHAANPWLRPALADQPADGPLVQHNAHIVRERYSLASCGRRLWSLLEQLAAVPRDGKLEPLRHGSRVLSSFLDVARFHPLRTDP